MSSPDGIGVDSEIGKLQKVIIHSPGREIQDMTPRMAEQLLYNDIIPLSIVSREYASFKKILQRVSEVYEYTDLLEDILRDDDTRRIFVDRITEVNSIGNRRDELIDMVPHRLVDTVVTGLALKNTSLVNYLSDKPYSLNPLPNLYFTRDAGMVLGRQFISGCMANAVRRTEAEIAAAVFSHHPALANSGFLLEGHKVGAGKGRYAGGDFSIEGGDLLVLSNSCLLLGCSERTSASAIDALTSRLEGKMTVIAVILPHERATIHLDMILTQIDRDELMLYKPYFFGTQKLRFVRIDIEPGSENTVTEVQDLLPELKKLGFDMKAVFCGNADPVQQEREQWLSGNNFFAVSPGKIIGYACNNYTMEALSRAGYEIKSDEDFLKGGDTIDRYRKLVIGISGVELARGGGGARCMTLPVKRMPV